MKATEKELRELKNRIAHAHAGAPLSYAKIGRNCGVHPSQVSRICRGGFKTISHNVVQICKELGIEMTVVVFDRMEDAGWSKVEASARRLWEKSDKNADHIAKLFDVIGQLRPA
jgi:hypothetical protein